MKYFFLSLAYLLLSLHSQAQDSLRKVKAVRTNLSVKIDGILNDEAWKTATTFSEFKEFRPSFGSKEGESTKTTVSLLYDNNAVYVSGFCGENGKDSISTELAGRDNLGINDYAGIMFDTYLDRINGVGFYVTALGEQCDVKYTLGYEDDSWSAVYQTATSITEKGWTFEMRIPYSALRFSKKDIQNWGVNIIRKRNKSGRSYCWNPVDPNKFGTMNQAGVLEGIENIKAPVRLSFSPYFSTYVNKLPHSETGKSTNSAVNGGMDLKYGLNKGFTLDMTLIPDFGQVQSDNQVLNLSPFEVKFNENRSFFTEGTELFNKGNLFYSRRIGGTPIYISKPYNATDSTGTILNNPSETKLVNATKLSGRTAKGLGIGIFNAITKPQFANIRKNATGEEYHIETSPWTNYNIVVLDQTMKNNSSITFINTNVLRSGTTYDANVSAVNFDLYDKKVNWNVWGKMANSNLIGYDQGKNLGGLLYEMNLGKFRGPLNFEIHHNAADKNYQQNDMGYFTNNNYNDYGLNAWYKLTKPRYFYNNINMSFGGTYSQSFSPRRYQYLDVHLRVNSQLKNLWNVGFRSGHTARSQDFYEPRISGKMFKRPGNARGGFYINSNPAKKYSGMIDFSHVITDQFKGNSTDLFLSNQYRFNDKLTVSLSSYNSNAINDVGFAFIENDSVYFGLRKRTTVENIAGIKYNFNIKMGITVRVRHYWSKVDYDRYFSLKDDGYLASVGMQTNRPENNANFFNVDLVYTWQFALGSFINVGWKDAGTLFNQQVGDRYYKNLGYTLKNPQASNFSLKVIYFLDYLSLKKKKK